MIPIIIYPVGGGGNWLSNVIDSLNRADFNIVPSSLHFHDHRLWKKTDLVTVRHGEIDLAPHNYDSFCGPQSSFITFVNAYLKRWLFHPPLTEMSTMDQFFYLTNDVKWRLGNDPIYNNLYLDRISLNTDWLFASPELFAQQLFDWLTQHDIEYTANLNFVLESIDNFKLTCHVDEHFGNTQSPVWQIWCHALVIEHNIPMDLIIRDDFNRFLKFIAHNNILFKDITQKQFLIKV